MVIQRTGGQDKRRKSLILNGARTDIARELEIDEGGCGRQRENEREEGDGGRYCEEQGRRDLSRSDVEDTTCSTGSSCSTILERVDRQRTRDGERERRRGREDALGEQRPRVSERARGEARQHIFCAHPHAKEDNL